MFSDISSPAFGLNYDPSHLVWQQMDYIRPLYEFRDRIFHVHAKDARIDSDALYSVGNLGLNWHTPKIPGLGDVNWPAFFAALKASGYKGPVVIEFEDKNFEGSEELIVKGLLQTKEYISPML
jgi:sugar phosphate isomerase/epimerase